MELFDELSLENLTKYMKNMFLNRDHLELRNQSN